MKSRFLTKCLVLSVFAVANVSFIDAGAMTTTTSTPTTTTTTTTSGGTTTQSTSGTLPGSPSGLSFQCDSEITGGLSAMTNAVITIPNNFISGFAGSVLSITGLSFAVNKLVAKISQLISKKASKICSQMVPNVADPSGQESSASSELSTMIGASSDNVADLEAIATQMEALTASLGGGGISKEDGEDLLNQFNALQDDQLEILEDIDEELTDLGDQHAIASGSSPATASTPTDGSLPGCNEVVFADPLAPTAAEQTIADSYMYCEPSATGVCCVSNCDAIITMGDWNSSTGYWNTPPTEAEQDLFDSFERCLPWTNPNEHCCFN